MRISDWSSDVCSSDLACFGEPMMELTRIDGEGGAPAYRPGYGGDTSNCAIAAARQGARVAYVSAVGDDRLGRELRALWRREGVGDGAVRSDTAAPTGERKSVVEGKGGVGRVGFRGGGRI